MTHIRPLAIAAAAALASAAPLLGALGRNLEYEYALMVSANCLVLLWALGWLLPLGFRLGVDLAWLLFLGPTIAASIVSLFYYWAHCPCSPPGTAFWLLLQALPSWYLGAAMLHAQQYFRQRGWSRLKAASAGALIYASLALHVAASLWFMPQKRVVHLLTGFLHGPIYDTLIQVDHGISLARGAHALLALSILFLCMALSRRQRSLAGLASAVGAAMLALSWQAGLYPSTWSGSQALADLLPETVNGPGFILHHAPMSTETDRQRLLHLARDSAFHIRELQTILGEGSKPVHIYVYPSVRSKKLWFGGGATDVTDVVTPSIHIIAHDGPHPTLRHELVHALAAHEGYHGLGFHPNMAFTEGLAVALAPEMDELSLGEGARALIDSNRLPTAAALFSPLFWQEAGARAYTTAGSVLQYLLERFGSDKVLALYRGGDWDRLFPESLAATYAQWRADIVQRYTQSPPRLAAEALFRHPGVLHDICPHTKAVNALNRDDPYVRLQQPLGWDPSRDYWPWRILIDPSDRLARMNELRARVNQLVKQTAASPAAFRNLLAELAAARQWPPQSIEDIELALLESDLRRLREGITGGQDILNTLAGAITQRDFGVDLIRQIYARLVLEDEPETAAVWRRYLAGWRQELPPLPAIGVSWMSDYLRLRRGPPEMQNQQGLIELLARPVPSGLPLSFTAEWYRFLGMRLLQAGDFSSAAGAYGQAKAASPAGSSAIFAEHQRRAEYYSKLGALP